MTVRGGGRKNRVPGPGLVRKTHPRAPRPVANGGDKAAKHSRPSKSDERLSLKVLIIIVKVTSIVQIKAIKKEESILCTA